MYKEESYILKQLREKTNNGLNVPIIEKNGINVNKLTIFEDICLRNLNNLDTIALEINREQMTYYQFILEVEKYIRSFQQYGLKEGDIVTLCMPVGVEFICSYFALTTIGVACNAPNILFLIKHGVKAYTEERCSKTLICYDKFYYKLMTNGLLDDVSLDKIIISSDSTYAHINGDSDKIVVNRGISNVDILTIDDLLLDGKNFSQIKISEYNENRISTLNYTSGTTGIPKCMAHSDLAPLFLNATHDHVMRSDEQIGDRSLLTIPLEHPTGLFYTMVLQLAQGKTLVLEPRYDKNIFHSDIRDLEINHAVQATPFYAQLVKDRETGKLKSGDFSQFKHPYSGGAGIPKSLCEAINDTLHYAGCEKDITVGYGRSEEGSIVIGAYNIPGRLNTVGKPLPGTRARLVDPITKKELPNKPGVVGEIQLHTPVAPLKHCYLGAYNQPFKSDESCIDEYGIRWSQPKDIATIVKCENDELSYLVLGRSSDSITRDGKTIYLFELKERISMIDGIQECEIISHNDRYITAHVITKANNNRETIIRKILNHFPVIDGIKFYNVFGINSVSGKCDIESMSMDFNDYFTIQNNQIISIDLEREKIKSKYKN